MTADSSSSTNYSCNCFGNLFVWSYSIYAYGVITLVHNKSTSQSKIMHD